MKLTLFTYFTMLLPMAFTQEDCGGFRRRELGVDENRDMHSRSVKDTTTSASSGNATGTIYTTEIVLEQESEPEFDWMKDHVDEMQARMHNGDVARAWDPLFQAYFQAFAKGEFETQCEQQDNGKMVCTKTALTECARDLIQGHGAYHVKVRNALRETGDAFIEEDQTLPETCT